MELLDFDYDSDYDDYDFAHGESEQARADQESRLQARFGSDWHRHVGWTQAQEQEDRRQRPVRASAFDPSILRPVGWTQAQDDQDRTERNMDPSDSDSDYGDNDYGRFASHASYS